MFEPAFPSLPFWTRNAMASPTMVPSNVAVHLLQRPLKADIRQFIEHVCFVPKADMAPMQKVRREIALQQALQAQRANVRFGSVADMPTTHHKVR